MLSEVFVLSPRGDTLIYKSYRGDVVKGTPDIFFRQLKKYKNDEVPPVFNLDSTHFIHQRTGGLHFVCVTKFNVSPAWALGFLTSLARLFKDFCGVLSEESLRLNFALVYELMDEAVDFGYPQGTSTDELRASIYDQPVVPRSKTTTEDIITKVVQKTISQPGIVHSSAAAAPVTANANRRNELFIDVFEKLTVLFNSSGAIVRCEVDGSIQVKSYLSGTPEVRMGLNDEILVGHTGGPQYGAIVLDDCSFHSAVKVEEFENSRTIAFVPPSGEFVAMTYRLSGEFSTPFRVFCFLEDIGPTRLDVIVRIRADIPESHFGSNLVVTIPTPRSASSVSADLMQGAVGQSFENVPAQNHALWKVTKLPGGHEVTLRMRLVVPDSQSAAVRKEIGNVNLSFAVANYSTSGIQIKYLKVMERSKSITPQRWVRYITHSTSYTCRL